MNRIVQTEDGSRTIFNSELNETYHSTHGAIAETNHIYIERGLKFAFDQFDCDSIALLEFGLGTGLNAIASLHYVLKQQGKSIDYHAVEKFPLDSSIIHELKYDANFSALSSLPILGQIHQAIWNNSYQIHHRFCLTKYKSDFKDTLLPANFFHLLYYDAFAPSKQAEVWTPPYLEHAHASLQQHGIFITYSASGALKRNLKAIGFEVENLPGPKGKREITRAIKI
jgi:tRNA U34 5-methylaminomethyl-2-thiouridine-forming methyltransferase MnmC